MSLKPFNGNALLRSPHRSIARISTFSRIYSLTFSITFALVLSLPAYANERWPVPSFNGSYDKPAQRQISEDLKASYSALHRHICSKPSPVTEAWRSKYRMLVMALIVNQHRAVWAASGSETQRDTATLDGFFSGKKKVFDALSSASRNSNETQARLNKIQDRLDQLIAGASIDYGRRAMLIHALRSWLAESNSDLENLARRHNVARQIDGLKRQAEASLEKAYQDLYTWTIVDINQRRLSRGMNPFTIYYPDGRDPNFARPWEFKQLTRAVGEAFASATGRAIDSLAFAAYETAGYHSGFPRKAFSESAAADLLGPCRTPVVQIAWSPERSDDAMKAAEILRENGFQPKLWAYPEDSAKANRGKLFIHHSGNAAEASKIADLVKGIESVRAANSSAEQRSDVLDYTLWLIDKDEEPKPEASPTPAASPTAAGEIAEVGWNTYFAYVAHWSPNAARWTVKCPPYVAGSYYPGVEGGPTYYAPNSSICAAAVHAGRITFETGGRVAFSYDRSEVPRTSIGSTRFGVTSETKNNWRFNYYFVD